MKIRTLLALPALFIALAIAPATAAECNGDVTEAGVVYYDDRGDDNVWVYIESGAAPGLQSGSSHAVLGYTDDCDAGGNYDLLVY